MEDNSKCVLNGCYEQVSYLGKGSYGTVFLYRKINDRKKNIFNDFFYGAQKNESQYFALKKYHPQFTKDKEGIDFSALRQINLLITIKHKNIASCHEIIHKKYAKGGQNQFNHHDVYVVLDFYLEMTEILTVPTIVKDDLDRKLICHKILEGLAFLHKNFIIHRDLKPQNIFVSRNGQMKISDFGFAKEFGSPHGRYTANTCTKQYRAPELFFGTHYYTQKSDIWSFGCIVAYIFKNKTIFYSQSQTDLQVLGRIFRLRGTPNQKTWPMYNKFPDFLRFEQTEEKNLQKELEVSQEVAKIIEDCLQLNPTRRPSVYELLEHPFFKGVDDRNLQMTEYYDNKLNSILKKSQNPNSIKANNNFQDLDF